MVLSSSDGFHTFHRFPESVRTSGEESWLITAWMVGMTYLKAYSLSIISGSSFHRFPSFLNLNMEIFWTSKKTIHADCDFSFFTLDLHCSLHLR